MGMPPGIGIVDTMIGFPAEDFSQYDLYPNGFSRMIVPIGVKSHRVGDQVTVDPYQQYMMKEAGLDPEKCIQLGDMLAARRPGRISATQITVYKAMGIAMEDMVAAHLVYEKAKAQRGCVVVRI